MKITLFAEMSSPIVLGMIKFSTDINKVFMDGCDAILLHYASLSLHF